MNLNFTSSYDFDSNNEDKATTDFSIGDGLESQFWDIASYFNNDHNLPIMFDNNNDFHLFRFDHDDRIIQHQHRRSQMRFTPPSNYPTPSPSFKDDSYSYNYNNGKLGAGAVVGLASIAALLVIGIILSVAEKLVLHQDNGNNTRTLNNGTNNTSPRPTNNNNNTRTTNSNNSEESGGASQQQQDRQAILRSKVIKVLFPEEKFHESKLKRDSEANCSYRWSRASERISTFCCTFLEGFQEVLFPEETIDESKLKYDSEANSYRSTRASERSSISCCICLEGFQEGDLILSGPCSHIYHRECVMVWIEQDDSCPVCRQPMFDEGTYKAVEQQVTDLDI